MKIDELIDFANKAKAEGATDAEVNCYENIQFYNEKGEVSWLEETIDGVKYLKPI